MVFPLSVDYSFAGALRIKQISRRLGCLVTRPAVGNQQKSNFPKNATRRQPRHDSALISPGARIIIKLGSVQSFSHIWFELSGARHWLKRDSTSHLLVLQQLDIQIGLVDQAVPAI
jgi:hypothetical protein